MQVVSSKNTQEQHKCYMISAKIPAFASDSPAEQQVLSTHTHTRRSVRKSAAQPGQAALSPEGSNTSERDQVKKKKKKPSMQS